MQGRPPSWVCIFAVVLGAVTTYSAMVDDWEDVPATKIETILPDKKDAKTLKLADFKGKKHVVLYFFPKALTGG